MGIYIQYVSLSNKIYRENKQNNEPEVTHMPDVHFKCSLVANLI